LDREVLEWDIGLTGMDESLRHLLVGVGITTLEQLLHGKCPEEVDPVLFAYYQRKVTDVQLYGGGINRRVLPKSVDNVIIFAKRGTDLKYYFRYKTGDTVKELSSNNMEELNNIVQNLDTGAKLNVWAYTESELKNFYAKSIRRKDIKYEFVQLDNMIKNDLNCPFPGLTLYAVIEYLRGVLKTLNPKLVLETWYETINKTVPMDSDVTIRDRLELVKELYIILGKL
jgi:predicted RecB family nuclease